MRQIIDILIFFCYIETRIKVGHDTYNIILKVTMTDSNVITKEGLEKIKADLAEIKNIKLKEVALKIKEAKDMGDLSENAEYHEAKNEQAFLYGKELQLEEKIRNATVIADHNCRDTIEAGCSIVIENEGDEMKFQIVGSTESNPASGKLSIDSPIGKALEGHKAGESVSVKAPAGEVKYKILSIT